MAIEKILMVDDDPSIRRIAEISLSRVGNWQVIAAENGLQAIELARKHNPDLILLDVMMPGLDGPSTLSKMQEQSSIPNTPVIFMTAKVQQQEVEAYHNAGVAGVIKKPFDPLKLPQEIESLVSNWENRV